jgi:oligosaccharide repeat unit polymerase
VGDTRGFGFFLLVAPSAMVLMVTGARTCVQKRIAYSIAAITLLLILFLGYRSSALFPTLIGAIIWVKTGRKIPVTVAVVSILVVLIAIPTVSTLRSLGAYKDISKEDFSQSLEQSELQDVFVQLGGVSTVIANVLKWVPAEDSYRYGQSYLLAFYNAIPNIGLNIGESGRLKAHDKGLVDKEEISLMNPGDWYTYKTSKYMFSIGGGSGFSTIAEAYLNFGLPGVILYFLLLGFLLGRLDQVDLRSSPKLMIFSGAMLWPLLKSVRNAFGVFLKPVAFILVSIMIWKAVSIWTSRMR